MLVLKHPLGSECMPLPYVPARVLGALVAHRHLFAPNRSRTSVPQDLRAPLSIFKSDLNYLVFDGWCGWQNLLLPCIERNFVITLL